MLGFFKGENPVLKKGGGFPKALWKVSSSYASTQPTRFQSCPKSDLFKDDFNGEAATKQRGQILGCFIFSPC